MGEAARVRGSLGACGLRAAQAAADAQVVDRLGASMRSTGSDARDEHLKSRACKEREVTACDRRNDVEGVEGGRQRRAAPTRAIAS
jgi:hypothetical protein